MAAHTWAADLSKSASLRNQAEHLSGDGQWLRLLHYSRAADGSWRSEVDSDSFFLSPDGATDPHAELIALLDALNAASDFLVEDQHIACLFPARVNWLVMRGLPQPIPPSGCPLFQKWKQQFDLSGLSLVFATASMNDPSSMFGHSFIRFRGGADNEDLMTSSTLNYYAEADEEIGIVRYIYRGFTGGFWGVIDDKKMFRRLREYADNQARDLWEFELDFAPAEIDMVVDHAWEIKDKAFRYYFIDDNCGYRTQRLLAVAKPLSLNAVKGYRSLPVDTIKELNQQSLITEINFIPSTKRQFQFEASQLNSAERRFVKKISAGKLAVDDADLRSLPVQSQVNVLSLVMKAMSARIQRNGLRDSAAYAIFYDAMDRRLELNQPVSYTQSPKRPSNPLVGHHSTRMRVGGVTENAEAKLLFDTRFVGHHLLDPPAGYPLNASLDFLGVTVAAQSEGITLDSARLLTAMSITPTSAYHPSHSWLFNISWDERAFGADQHKVINFGGGYGYSTALAGGHVGTALLLGGTNGSDNTPQLLDVEVGGMLAVTRQHERASYQVSFKSSDYLARPVGDLREIKAQVAVFPTRNFAIEFNVADVRSAGESFRRYGVLFSIFK